ncbi:MAG: TIGR03619 family F420-dependent LLM class oxidoreductase [Mycetocola sp.]
MKFNFSLPNNQQVTALTDPWMRALDGPDLARIVREADAMGFHKVTVGEHFVIPREHVAASGAHYMQSTTILSYLAASAPTIRVGSNITLVALQHPIVQAKMWGVLDWVSGGRTDINIGVGWLKEEFDLLGVDFHRRGKIVDEHVAAMIELWSSDRPTFHGQFVDFDDIAVEPRPVQRPHPPLWFAGDAPAVARRVAKWGVGWSPYLTKPEQFPEFLDRVRNHREYTGQPLGVYYVLLNLELGEEHQSRESGYDLAGWNAEHLVDELGRLGELGVTEVSAPLTTVDSIDGYLDRLRWVSEEVMPKVP